jgi:hypothetical protein
VVLNFIAVLGYHKMNLWSRVLTAHFKEIRSITLTIKKKAVPTSLDPSLNCPPFFIGMCNCTLIAKVKNNTSSVSILTLIDR